MRKTALNVIMGMILAGSVALAYASEATSEIAAWSVAGIVAAIFLVEQIEPKDE